MQTSLPCRGERSDLVILCLTAVVKKMNLIMDCPVKIQKVEYPECIISKGADVLAV